MPMPNEEVLEQEQKTKTKKTPKELTIFILKIVGNVVFYLVILALLLFSIMNINAGSKNGGFPNLFGKGFLSVQSNSMTIDKYGMDLPEQYNDYKIKQFAKGDLLYVDVVDANRFQKLKVGDVVTFFDQSISNLNSHRIVYITYNADNTIQAVSVEGDYAVTTMGYFDPTDASKTQANHALQSSGNVQTLTQTQVLGVATGVGYGAGGVLDNLRNNWLWYFVFPVVVFLIVEIYFVIRNILELRNEKRGYATEPAKALSQDQLDLIRQQIKAELEAEAKKKEQENNSINQEDYSLEDQSEKKEDTQE